MGKKFKILTSVSSNEVSLCSKYNSGANKQTEFELVKDKEGAKDRNMKPVIENLIKFADFYGEPVEVAQKQEFNAFKDFLNYWLEYDINHAYYNILSEALQNALYDIKCREDITKEEKVQEYQKLFDMFIEEYKNLPITKTQDGKYEVSLVSNSHIQDVNTNPQNETEDITKEKTTKMKKEQMSVIEKVTELLKSAFGVEETETPAEEQPEVQQEPVEEQPAEEVAKTEEVEAPAEEAEVEAPVVEEEVEVKEAETEQPAEEVAEEETPEAPVVEEEAIEPTELEKAIQKSLDLQKELDELKKAKEEKETEIEKMSFVQKAKDEFSMLSGTAEEIGEKLYSISKSNLDDASKEFIMEQLKKVSKENQELTEEVGSITKNAGDMTDEDVVYAKAEEIAKAKGISVKKALREIK